MIATIFVINSNSSLGIPVVEPIQAMALGQVRLRW